MQNKHTYFKLILPLTELQNNNHYLENLEDKTDLVLSGMGATNTIHKFHQVQGEEIVYFFKINVKNRKRKGQLVKLCNTHLDERQDYKAIAITKFAFENDVLRYRKNANFLEIINPEIISGYSGKDIEKFNDINNWFSWETQIFNKLFIYRASPSQIQNAKIREADERKIISLYCPYGKSGKSQFFKWLSVNRQKDIGRIGYGTASQLKSSITNIGPRPIWLIDLARAKTKDQSQTDLLSTVEDLKGGTVLNAMYGSGDCMFFDPTHVIISSNYMLDYESLSADRWEVYKITQNKKLMHIKNPEQYMRSNEYKKEQKKNNSNIAIQKK